MNTLTIISFIIASTICVQAEHEHHEDHGHVSYKFSYGVEDHHTGDIKSQHEHRHGKEVSGVYTLKEADGTTRIVKYHAGPHKGFTAEVERVGHAQHAAHYGHGGDGGLGGGSSGGGGHEGLGSFGGSDGGHGGFGGSDDGHKGLELGGGFGGGDGGHEGGSSFVGTTHFGYKH